MKITWEDYAQIADALAEKYTDVDLVNVTDEEVIEMVKTIDGFEGEDQPSDPDIVSAIINVWIQVADGSGFDDSEYDAYV